MLKFKKINESLLKVSGIPENWFDTNGEIIEECRTEFIDCESIESDPANGIAYFTVSETSKIIIKNSIGQIEQFWSPVTWPGKREVNMKRYRFKLAIISGLYCRSTKVYLQYTKRFIIQGYEKIYY